MNLKKSIYIPLFAVSAGLLSLIVNIPAYANISWLSRANCCNNESVTWDWPFNNNWYLRTISEHYKSESGQDHFIDTYWGYTWRSYAGHWGEGFSGGWVVNGAHYMTADGNPPIYIAYTSATNCNAGDWFTTKGGECLAPSKSKGQIDTQTNTPINPFKARKSKSFSLKIIPLNELDDKILPPSFKERQRNIITTLKNNDILDVEEDKVPNFEQVLEKAEPLLKPLSVLQNQNMLRIKPASLRNTPLHRARFMGAKEQGGKLEDGWTGLFRLFDASDLGLGLITLEEVDHAASGTEVSLISELLNADVNGFPAALVSKKTPSGKTMTTLLWFANGKEYKLSIRQIDPQSRKTLLDIGRSIN